MSASLLAALTLRTADANALTCTNSENDIPPPLSILPALFAGSSSMQDSIRVEASSSSSSEEEDGVEDGARAFENRSFTLHGETWTFENPVPLVLSAARQLGMAIGRDASLLWIADEALLDEAWLALKAQKEADRGSTDEGGR